MIALQHSALRQPQVSIPYRTPGEFLYRDDFRVQHFVFDSTMPQSLLTAGGMQLTIPACAFISKDQKKRIFGEVEFQLKELYTASDMLLLGRPTTSNGALLEAVVQFQIRAFAHEQPLELILPLEVRVPMASLKEKPHQILTFSGGASGIQTLSGQKVFDWKYASGLLFQNSRSEFCHFRVDRCGWWACQKAHNSRVKKAMMSARVIGEPAVVRQMEGLLLFKDIPAIVRMYPGVHGFTALNIPEGLQVSALIFGNHQNQLFAGRSAWENSSRKMLNVPLHPVNKASFWEMLV